MRIFPVFILFLAPIISNAQKLDFSIYAGGAKSIAHPVTQFEKNSAFSIKGTGLRLGLGLNIDFYLNNLGLRTGIGSQKKSYIFNVNLDTFQNATGYHNTGPGIAAYEIPLQLLYKKPVFKQKANIVFHAGPVLAFNRIFLYSSNSNYGIKEDMPAGDTMNFDLRTNFGDFPVLPTNIDLQAGVNLETNRENKSNFGAQLVYQYGFAKMPPVALGGSIFSNNYYAAFYKTAQTRLSYIALRLAYKPKFLSFK